MSETFDNILVKDDRLGCITPKVKYQVLKGGKNITCQACNAISQSTTNHVYNVAVPTLETIISREVLWKSTVTLKISCDKKGRTIFNK
ncbi:MAG: phage major capsid domain-containing protein [Candidatus Fonsibacter sp.]